MDLSFLQGSYFKSIIISFIRCYTDQERVNQNSDPWLRELIPGREETCLKLRFISPVAQDEGSEHTHITC